MREEDYNKVGADLVQMFGDRLPDPMHEPIQFLHYLKLYLFELKMQNGAG